jgi:plastocyanin
MSSFVTRRTLAIAAATSFIVLVATGAIAQQQPAPQQVAATDEAEISIQNFHFMPETLTVKAGTAVTWMNHDEEPHNVVSLDRVFRSKAIDGGEKFTATFDKLGTYKYICAVHPQMHGQIVVQ